jgi:uncharacterized protein
MKNLLVVILLCVGSASVCAAQQSPADQPASKADIDRYYQTMHIREMTKSTMDAVSKQMRQMMHDQLQKVPNLPPDAEEKMNKMYDDMLKNMPLDDILDAMEPVYQKHFTKGDIDSLIAFYSTPVGQKMLVELPTITQEAMQASSGIMRKYMDQTMQQVQDQLAQMLKDSQRDSKKSTSTN